MRPLSDSQAWQNARRAHKYQKLFGAFSGICFAVALVALLDGLAAQMRAGNNAFSILPGESVILSGPTALKNPLASDMAARFTPPDAPLSFKLDSFFTGYWFGSGMWRGSITALPTAAAGRYELAIFFPQAPAQNAQHYAFTIFSSPAAMRRASLSLLTRLCGINPFLLAAASLGVALGAGALTYIFGRAYALDLRSLGLAQIWLAKGAEIWCIVPKHLCPPTGADCLIVAKNGHPLLTARVQQWRKGKLRLSLPPGFTASPDSLVAFGAALSEHGCPPGST